jgi:hypothetical protein
VHEAPNILTIALKRFQVSAILFDAKQMNLFEHFEYPK